MRLQSLSDSVSMIQISPLDSNMYVINNTLLIDTTSGYHTTLIKKAFDTLNLDFSDISCIINTHTHPDHMGGNTLFKNAKVMMHEKAMDALKESTLKNTLARYYRTTIKDTKIHVPLEDGDTIRAKGTRLDIIHTPGHSMDSISLYMPEEKYLFTGDSIPVRIDKKISYYIKNRETESVSMNKLKSLDIERLLPGHGQTINSLPKINELLER